MCRPTHTASTARRHWLRWGSSFLLGPLGDAGGAAAPAGPARPSVGTQLAVLVDDGSRLAFYEAGSLALRSLTPLPQACRELIHKPAARGTLFAAGTEGQLLALSALTGQVLAQAELGSGAVRAALSSDGRWLLAVANGAAQALVLLDAQPGAGLRRVKAWPLPGPVAWLADAPHRRSFVLALAAPAQVWEIAYDERAEDFYEGLVHDYRMGEGVPQRGFHNARRMSLSEPLLDATADPEATEWAGRGLVFNLDVRRVVARPAQFEPCGAGAGALVQHQGDAALAVPLRSAHLALLRCGDWAHLATWPLGTPARWARCLPDSALVWLDQADGLGVFNTASGQWSARWPTPGPLVAPPRFSADGRTAWALTGGPAGVLLAIDSARLQLLHRGPHSGALDLAPL